MLREMRNKEVKEGTVLLFAVSQIPAPTIPGLVLSLSAPMVQHTQHGQEVVAQKVKMAFVFDVMVGRGTNIPMALLDGPEDPGAVEFLKELTDLVESLNKRGSGGTGGSIIQER